MSKRPNFFIIGAPKCGTTSLAAWLSGHPNVFVSDPKEPNYYNFDYKFSGRLSREKYDKLFADAGSEHIAIGEATTGYLRSAVALSEIYKELSPVKIVVCIRNPIEMAVSMHRQRLVEGMESEGDFYQAWKLQSERSGGRCIPIACSDVKDLMYGNICMIGAQLAEVYNIFPVEDVQVVVLDDLVRDPRCEYLTVLNFLGVEDDGRNDFYTLNEAKDVSSSSWAVSLLKLISIMKKFFPFRMGLGLSERVTKTLPKANKKGVEQEVFLELSDFFRKDVEGLSNLLGRDFSYWLSKNDR